MIKKTLQTNIFRFFGYLNRFLPKEKRYKRFQHTVKGYPSIKDTLEALGVPHTEIDGIVIDGRSKEFSYQTKGDHVIMVYPRASKVMSKAIKRLKPKLPVHPRFIADLHLGKLMRHLRLLGFDCCYDITLDDPDIVRKAVAEKRIVLTRDIGILKNRVIRRGYFVRSTDARRQIRDVLQDFDLKQKVKPLSRCVDCNGLIKRVAKKEIEDRLPFMTKQCYHVFYQCRACSKIYWQGAHFKDLNRFIKKIQQAT